MSSVDGFTAPPILTFSGSFGLQPKLAKFIAFTAVNFFAYLKFTPEITSPYLIPFSILIS